MATRRALARGLLAFATVLVLMQTLGLMHAVVHSPAAAPAAQVEGAAAGVALPGPRAVASLFNGHEAGSATCGWYDHLLQPYTLPGLPALALPCDVPAAPAQAHDSRHFAAQALGFLARGPPAA